jgi:transposase
MVRVPTIEEEDRRRIGRERKTLVKERTVHTNRIKGLLFGVGIRDYVPNRRDRRERLEELRTGDGKPLPIHLKAQLSRELDRLELLAEQIKRVEAERDDLCAAANETAPQAMLTTLKGIGPEFANVLASEGLFRHFDNRRQVAAYAGLAPSPWRSGSIDREQGVSKSGNPRLRTTMIQLSWLWLRYQPDSTLARWFQERISHSGGRGKKVAIVALARKLLVAFWKFAMSGVVIEGAVMAKATLHVIQSPGPDQPRRIQANGPIPPMASTADNQNGSVLLSPTRRTRWGGRPPNGIEMCQSESL